MFGKDFLVRSPAWNQFILDFPFFRLDDLMPFDLPPLDTILANEWFQRIFDEYHSDHVDKFFFIQDYTSLLLHLTKRYFHQFQASQNAIPNPRTTDILLVSRFQTLIETTITNADESIDGRSPAFYAGALHVHPNHLNAVVKRTTGKVATTMIQDKLITVAKSLLRHEGLSIKEIAYKLQFTQPAHFTSFFKKATGFTPQQYQQNQML